MKRYLHIVTLFLLSMTGCSKSYSSGEAEEYNGYIFFSQGIETKAALVESADAMGQFGVVGFKYDKSLTWETHKATNPTPNVFYNDAGTENEKVETLTCNDDGTASYTPLQGWSNINKYAFFAYYPIGNGNVTLANLDGTAYTGGVPAVKYSMSTTGLKESMVDVMTATAHTDKYWLSATESNVVNNDIEFSFSHRLSCLGVQISNSSEGSIVVKNVKVNISGVRHKEIIIPLDGTDAIKSTESSPLSALLDLTLSEEEKILLPFGNPVEISDKLIFIPQTEDLSVQVQINYMRSPMGNYGGYEDTVILPSQPTPLSEGRKHLVRLNFTDSNVTVTAVADSQGWVDIPEVEDSFN